MAPVNKTILIVDDDQDYLFQLKMKVEKFGYKTITADSQEEAEELLERIKPDLAILDLMMEKEDSGFILCYRMKKKYPDVPIIIATGVAAETGIIFDIQDENNRKWIKADRFLDKGIRSELLKMEIEKLLQKPN
ncbi:MAG: response regulator [Bacteroidales bacterium]|nr:response regulator [Bacteroidales bacterium]NCA76120.1 response regulator [Alphaproteobacteria bacterium]HPS50698.1 response regulator [Bacteroidales bacterium]HRZ22204.1 response regulator [Bacteroidales bacterium]